jgi:hypothetical protein
LDRCFGLSFACSNTDFHESKFENIMLFESLIADTTLSAKLQTHLLYDFTMESGEFHLFTNPVKLSLNGFYAD